MYVKCVKCNNMTSADDRGEYICPICFYNTRVDGAASGVSGRKIKEKSMDCPHCGKKVKITISHI